jgi:hypothetical protein
MSMGSTSLCLLLYKKINVLQGNCSEKRHIDDVERQKEESQNATGYVFTGGAFVGNTREYDTYIQ